MDSPHAVPPALAGLPPDWVLDRDLPCGGCGYNMRGRREPRCTECGATFRWQDLLKVTCPRCDTGLMQCDEAACPNCELPLDWARLLSSAAPRGRDHYEFSMHGLGSVLRTWRKAMRPVRFWSNYRLEDPPQHARLKAIRRSALLIGIGGLLIIPFTAAFHAAAYAALNAKGLAPEDQNGFMSWQIVALLAQALKSCLYLSLLLLPYALIWFGLPRFAPTLARFRVRPAHFTRIGAYSAVGVLLIGVGLGGSQIGAEWMGYELGLPAKPVVSGYSGEFVLNPVLQLWWRIQIDSRMSNPNKAEWMWLLGYAGIVLSLLFIAILVWQWIFCFVALRCYLRLTTGSAAALTLSVAAITLLAIPTLFAVIQVLLWDLPRLRQW